MGTWLLDAGAEAASPETTFDEVIGLWPDLSSAYADAMGTCWAIVDPVALELCRLRVATLQRCSSELAVRYEEAVVAGLTEAKIDRLGQWPSDDVFTDDERACVEYAEQYAIDAHGVSERMVGELKTRLGDDTYRALQGAIALFDGFGHFRNALALASVDGNLDELVMVRAPEVTQLDFGTAWITLWATLMRKAAVDPALMEMARLRNAKFTDCVHCRSIRFSRAIDAGLDEDRIALIDDFETSDLSSKEKAVLRYTDAVLLDPRHLSPELGVEMLGHFNARELVELTAGIAMYLGGSKWNIINLGKVDGELPVHAHAEPEFPQ